MRFLSDYENLINYINFFSLNPNYIEAANYHDKFQRLKVISINRYFKYISNSVNKLFNDFEGIQNPGVFFNYVLNFNPANVDKKYYSFPKFFEKIKEVQLFFEEKSKNCPDLKCTCDKLKYNFIDQRRSFMKKFYDKIFEEMNNNYKQKDTKKYFSEIFEVFKITVCEVFYFMEFFQTKIIDNTFMLQNHINYIYESLYSTLRPIIVHSHSIDELIILFNCISNYFSIFFIEETTIPESKSFNEDIRESSNEENEAFQRRVYEIFNSLINNEVNIFAMPSSENNNLSGNLIEHNKPSETKSLDETAESNYDEDLKSRHNFITFDEFKMNFGKVNELIQLAKILIRPLLIKIVQDIQEKIFLKISVHLKNNLLDIDQDLQHISKYEEVLNSSYDNFSLFHFFLRKLSVLLELLRNVVSKAVLNDIAVLAIEKFIQILNEEILNKKSLSFEFEFYIIQQLILAIKLLNEFEIEATESDVEIDMFSITDAFKNNFNNIFFENILSIKDMIINSAPKIYEGTRDFKKILFNNLLKSYKLLINIVNNYIFGKENIDLILKIRNKEKIDEKVFEEIIGRNYDVISDIYMKFDTILNEIKNQIFIVDENIAEKLSSMIMDNCYNILRVLKDELKKKLGFESKDKGNESSVNQENLDSDSTNSKAKTKTMNPYDSIYQKLVDFIEGELLNLNMRKIKNEIFKN